MRRALAAATCVLLAAGTGAATEAPPVPPAPELISAVATRNGSRMTVRVQYRLPPGVAGEVRTAWRAFAGPRSSGTLDGVAHGVRSVAAADGTYRFTARARIGSGTDRSGGFCVVPDFAALGLQPVRTQCMRREPVTRHALTARVPEVTVFGDSVAATFDWVPGTREAIAVGLSVRYDLRSCRRLIAAPCPPGPPSVLESVQSLPGSLGDVAVINVGYNDWESTYDVSRVMRALRVRGVRRVVWVTLRGIQSSYRGINAGIRLAARRAPRIQVADWDDASRGQAWFGADQVHLTTAGGWGLAAFTRREIREAVGWLRGHPEA